MHSETEEKLAKSYHHPYQNLLLTHRCVPLLSC